MYGSNTAVGYYPEQVTGMNGFIDDLGNFVGGVIGLPKAETPGGINPSDPAAGADDSSGDNATVNPNAGNDDSAPMDTTTMLLYVAVAGVAVYVLGKYAFDWW